jgi:hypothetical protein
MAKTKQDKKLYSKMRDQGIRKKVARELSELPARVSGGKRAPKPMREAVERLEGLVEELKRHTTSGERQSAARKAARTRSQKAEDRSAAARKAARTRASGSRRARSGASAAKSRTGGSSAKSRAGASAARSAAKPRTAASRSKSRTSTSRTSGAKSRGASAATRSRARRSS